jgi:hypothetical protein
VKCYSNWHCAQGSFEEAVERIDKRTGAHVPKRQVEEAIMEPGGPTACTRPIAA